MSLHPGAEERQALLPVDSWVSRHALIMGLMIERENAGSLELGDVPRRWRQLDYLHQRAIQVSQTQPLELTPCRTDQSRRGGHRLYSNVERALGAARDCDLALRALLKTHGATQTAMWALMRTQFEAAFWALWPLDPTGTTERVLRGIQIEWRDDRASQAYFRDFADDPTFPFVGEDRRKARDQAADRNAATYRAEAAANGADWRAPPHVDLTRELTGLSTVQEPGWGSMLRGVWRSLAP